MKKENKTTVETAKVESTLRLIIILIAISMLASGLSIYYINQLDSKIYASGKEIKFLFEEYRLINKIELSLLEYQTDKNGLEKKIHLIALIDALNGYSKVDKKLEALNQTALKTKSVIGIENKEVEKKEIAKFRKKLKQTLSEILQQIILKTKITSDIYRQKQIFMLGMYAVIYLFSFLMLMKIYYKTKKNETYLKNVITKNILLSEEKENFLSTMSHEIRTPLNGIIGIISLLKINLKDKNEETESLLHKLEFASNHLLCLVNDILTFSKLKHQEERVNKSEFNVEDTILEVTEFFTTRAQEKQLEIIVKIEPLIPATVIGDRQKLVQILTNLISNSIKFTSKGYIKIEVTKEKEVENTIFIRFEIEDSGIGIPDNKLELIFEPFKQISDPSIKPKEGTGLGLAICHSLVSLMGGEISITSEVNKGTTITFVLPYTISKRFNELYLDTIKEISVYTFTQENKELQSLYKDLFDVFEMKEFKIFSSTQALTAFLQNIKGKNKKTLVFWDTDHAKDELESFLGLVNIMDDNTGLCLLGISQSPIISDYLSRH